MSGQIRTEINGAVGSLIVDYPARRNAISQAMWDAIPGALQSLENDTNVRVIVVTGAGEEAFVAGADISEFEKSRMGPASEAYALSTRTAFCAVARCAKPTIAKIHGFCIGGGCALALSTDLRYAADDALFAIPPARLGLGYAPENVEALRHVVGEATAKEILLTARRLPADEARVLGIIHRVLPKAELNAYVEKAAKGVASNAPMTMRAAKICLEEQRLPPGQRDQDRMDDAVRACFDSEDYQEGVRAFLEKRRAAFQGK